ncbi:hypothetical protein GmHk_02G005139 [Glycine max]|nr:hypothetical protein GmHk_02G005139 [Glycine max]
MKTDSLSAYGALSEWMTEKFSSISPKASRRIIDYLLSQLSYLNFQLHQEIYNNQIHELLHICYNLQPVELLNVRVESLAIELAAY